MNNYKITLLLDSVPTSHYSIKINQFRVPAPIYVLPGMNWKPGRCYETEITIPSPANTPETITIVHSNEETKVEMKYKVLRVKEVGEYATTYQVELI